MISRYQRKIMENLWSDKHKFDTFLTVELACSKAWQKLGLFSMETLDRLNRATYKLEDIYSIEKETKHDVIAFTKAVGLSLGEEKKWLHYGLTSTDIVDTAQSLILRDVNQIIKDDLEQLMAALQEKAYLYKTTPCIGRTHGIHAEVTSFGLKFALWFEDLKRIKKIFEDACQNIEIAKLSGAVGNYSANTPEMEKWAAQYLNLKPANIATQTLQRDRHAQYLSSIALIGSELEKIAVEIRHLSRTEINEVSEYFDINQKGSSAMPHKRNPIATENISGLSRVLRGYMTSSFENIPLWHERDISHSSVERIILPDATSVIDYMLQRMTDVLNNLVINQKRMLENIDMTHGVVYAQDVLNLLIQKKEDRQIAYDEIQKEAFRAMNEGRSFLSLLEENHYMREKLTKEELKSAFDIEKHLRFVDDIYRKVFE